ncbi:MAG: hypothetical protein V3R16_02355 [Nitrospirales bacterium]
MLDSYLNLIKAVTMAIALGGPVVLLVYMLAQSKREERDQDERERKRRA